MAATALLVAAVLAGQPCDRGALSPKLALEAERRGLLARSFQATVQDVRTELDRGRPVAACVRRRFLLIQGYDDSRGAFRLHDGRLIKYGRLMKRWEGTGRWALLLVPSEERSL